MTYEQLGRIVQLCPNIRLAGFWPHLTAACTEFEIIGPKRQAAFLAQLAHESGEFRYFEELWGPTPAQERYEGHAALGNTEPGDGRRFKGRGPLQITGRRNYRDAGIALGLDLEKDPKRAADADVGFRIAGWFWRAHGLNWLADQLLFDSITRKINGGSNGAASRQRYYKRALAVLASDAQ